MTTRLPHARPGPRDADPGRGRSYFGFKSIRRRRATRPDAVSGRARCGCRGEPPRRRPCGTAFSGALSTFALTGGARRP